MPSPNEEGPAYTNVNPLAIQNVPNVSQDGRNSYCEGRQIGRDATTVIPPSMSSTASSTLNMVSAAPISHKKRIGPGLQITTALKTSAPPPSEIPIPTLPMTSITAILMREATAEGTPSVQSEPKQEHTPMSISTPEAAANQNDVGDPSFLQCCGVHHGILIQ
ncbi:hypothetical protein BGX34_000372 [Mortierella sp. NVP85]|nr:hypothetical protein BGX34_000372 [Mortierella sp. NVP85]